MVPRQRPALGALYQLAKLQGEGLGSAYEYLVKLRLLDSWLDRGRIRSVVIMGLPERYGSSLEIIWWLQGADVTVVELDKERIRKLECSIERAIGAGIIHEKPVIQGSCKTRYDLGVSGEVVQSVRDRPLWARALARHAARVAVFAPNKGNAAHESVTRLGGVSAAQLQRLFPGSITGYCDSPPFPPGSSAKGYDMAWALPFLSAWSLLDSVLSTQSRSHLVYCLR